MKADTEITLGQERSIKMTKRNKRKNCDYFVTMLPDIIVILKGI